MDKVENELGVGQSEDFAVDENAPLSEPSADTLADFVADTQTLEVREGVKDAELDGVSEMTPDAEADFELLMDEEKLAWEMDACPEKDATTDIVSARERVEHGEAEEENVLQVLTDPAGDDELEKEGVMVGVDVDVLSGVEL